MAVRTIEAVTIWDHSPLNADNYMRDMIEDHDLDIQIADSVQAAVEQADIIISVTAIQHPLIKADWLKQGVHITAMASPAIRELHTDVLQRADVIIVDSLEQATTQGEIYHALKNDTITAEDIQGELGSLVIGKIPGRTRPDQITVADLTGLDSQDTVLATLALEKALFFGLGQRIEVGLGQKGLNLIAESLL
jgi:ornithine cyclodeaminase